MSVQIFLASLPVLLIILSVSTVNGSNQVHPDESPSLTLLDPDPDDIAIPNWPGDRPLPNSMRAWHYLPAMVQPLLEFSRALDETLLPRSTYLMLAAVVASRNHCLY